MVFKHLLPNESMFFLPPLCFYRTSIIVRFPIRIAINTPRPSELAKKIVCGSSNLLGRLRGPPGAPPPLWPTDTGLRKGNLFLAVFRNAKNFRLSLRVLASLVVRLTVDFAPFVESRLFLEANYPRFFRRMKWTFEWTLRKFWNFCDYF